MGTTKSGIWFPEPGDTYNEVSTLATMASSIEDAVGNLTRRRVAVVDINPLYANQGTSTLFRVFERAEMTYLSWGVSNKNLKANTNHTLGTIPLDMAPSAESGTAYGVTVSSNMNALGRMEVRPSGEVVLQTGNVLGSYYLATAGFSWESKTA